MGVVEQFYIGTIYFTNSWRLLVTNLPVWNCVHHLWRLGINLEVFHYSFMKERQCYNYCLFRVHLWGLCAWKYTLLIILGQWQWNLTIYGKIKEINNFWQMLITNLAVPNCIHHLWSLGIVLESELLSFRCRCTWCN